MPRRPSANVPSVTNTVLPLPPAFVAAISAQLGPDAAAFFATYADPPTHGLRVNPAKIDLATLRTLTGWDLPPIPWCADGGYVDAGVRAGAHPFHAAGLYYLQEPTAMAVAGLADLHAGQTVLDLAASPGGKSTQIASAIGPTGLLVANEILPARIKALGENLERWGTTNTVITNRAPDALTALGPVFDRVIVDAPCSGEGLFRRGPEARREWSPERVAGSAARQREILAGAVKLLGPGGKLVYSTCTFNQTENEDVTAALLATHADLGIEAVRRYWPHTVRGEGHTMHLLHRPGSHHPAVAYTAPVPAQSDDWRCFADETFTADPLAMLPGVITERNGRVILAPLHPVAAALSNPVRAGLWLGDSKPGRFEPSHALALAIDPAHARARLGLTIPEAHRWIAGEPVAADGPAGWVLVTVAAYALGWGKRSAGTVKNHYPKGLRRPIPR